MSGRLYLVHLRSVLGTPIVGKPNSGCILPSIHYPGGIKSHIAHLVNGKTFNCMSKFRRIVTPEPSFSGFISYNKILASVLFEGNSYEGERRIQARIIELDFLLSLR